jgi:hypothetical protein
MMKQYFLAFLIILHANTLTHAQINANIIVTPEERAPYSLVTLTLSSVSFDTTTSRIVWKINNNILKDSVGGREFSVRLGNIGENTIVNVTATTKNGSSIEQQITLSPSSLTLIHEAPKSHVPFFYEGRSFGAVGGLTKITALPVIEEGGSIVPHNRLSYTWYLNSTPMPKQSGMGRQSFSFALDYLRDESDVRVVVRTEGGKTSTKTITLKPFDIEPRLYSFNEILGTLLTEPFDGRIETAKPFALSIEPYFLSTKEDKPPVYKWFLDGIDVTGEQGTNLGFVPKNNSFGVQKLRVDLEGPDKRLQKKSVNAEIIFDTR